ncbi:MAG: hypothetical protein U5L04_17070 [Trueperaceae bacterium]|nr:hypothetical protein [Trueperaceae bacterium]
MAKKSKKQAKQRSRRAEKREERQQEQEQAKTPQEQLLERIRFERRVRHERVWQRRLNDY